MMIQPAWIDWEADSECYEAIEERALMWLVWLRSGEATLEDAQLFRRWRSCSRGHRRAVRKLALLWQALGALAELVGSD